MKKNLKRLLLAFGSLMLMFFTVSISTSYAQGGQTYNFEYYYIDCEEGGVTHSIRVCPILGEDCAQFYWYMCDDNPEQ